MLETLTSLVSPTILFGVVVILGIIFVILSIVLLRRSEEDVLTKRIEYYASREEIKSIEDIELSLSLSDRIIVPILRRMSNLVNRLAPQQMLDRVNKQLEAGGKKTSASEYFGASILFFVIVMILAFVLRPEGQNGLLVLLMGAVFGFLMPRMWLSSAVKNRKDAVIKKLPDALDLMTICVDAGLTFDGAMAKVDEKWDDPLANEFGRVVYELQLGKTRRQALRDMSDRLDVSDVQSFIASILQADQLGVSIGKVLRIQSQQMRVRRRQRAEEKAQQAPIKMLFPMVFLIFPAMFIVLLGPAVLRVMRTEALTGITGG